MFHPGSTVHAIRLWYVVVPMSGQQLRPEHFESNYREPNYQFLHSQSFIYKTEPQFVLTMWWFYHKRRLLLSENWIQYKMDSSLLFIGTASHVWWWKQVWFKWQRLPYCVDQLYPNVNQLLKCRWIKKPSLQTQHISFSTEDALQIICHHGNMWCSCLCG